jgi:hypothetical protein
MSGSHLCIPRNETVFPKQIIMFCTLLYLWEIYKFPGLVCLFCCRGICGPILGIYKLLTDTWMWKLGLRPCNFQKKNTQMGFSLQCSIKNFKKRIKALGLPIVRSGLEILWASNCKRKKIRAYGHKGTYKIVLHADSKSLGCNFVC